MTDPASPTSRALATRAGSTLAPRAAAGRFATLPVGTDEVLADLSPGRVLDLEKAHGNGALIRALDILPRGKHLIHAGGYAAVPFGERYPPLVSFVERYLAQGGATGLGHHATAWRAALETNLVALLASQLPSHADSRVLFSNSGSEAIEVALKLVRANRPDARALITFGRAYHGKTFGALSVTPNAEYQDAFRPLLPDVHVLPYGDANALEAKLYQLGPANVAGIVLEPVQGEGGVRIPPPDFLPALQDFANRYGIVTVADEIQSGLGRTGQWFASAAGGLDPDVITLAKPLGGGLTAIGATIARRDLVDRMLPGLKSKRHSSTFAGNSLAMAVGLRSLELLVEEGLVERSRRLGHEGLVRLQAIQSRYPGWIADVRGVGMLFAIELRNVLPPAALGGSAHLAGELGAVLGLRELHQGGVHACFSMNADGVVRLTPALNTPDALFDELFDRIERVARRNRRAFFMLPRTPLPRLLRLVGQALG